MSFLRSLRSDLFSRPLLPLVILACAGLIGAVVYVASSGGSSSPVSAPIPPVSSTLGASNSVLSAVNEVQANPNQATSEMTGGSRYQNQGQARNPFKALPEPAASKPQVSTTTSTTPTTPSTTPSTTSPPPVSESPSSSSTGEKTTTPTKTKPKTGPVYTVDLEFGPAPTTPGQASELKSYTGLKRLAPIPSKSDSLLVFTGVSSSGKGVILTMVRAAIIKGEAVCLPSTSQCEMLDMAAGESEQMDYLQSNGETTVYQLKVLSITKSTKDASTASYLNGQVSQAGRTLLMRSEPPALHRLRFSQSKGVLLYIPQR